MDHVTRLSFADGSIWNIVAGNDRAYDVVSALAKTMQLQLSDKSVQNRSSYSTPRRLIINVESHKTDSAQLSSMIYLKFEDKYTIVCNLIFKENDQVTMPLLVHVSGIICRDAHYRGGVLLHGALAGWNGNGVILAGPGGRGKTTASRRLPHYWQSFCDDTTLLVCDNKGEYWAHPWPTWSSFTFNGSGDAWDVQRAIPLKGIFFLEQAYEDKLEPLEIAQNVCLLSESAEQASWLMPGHEGKNALREFRLQRFDNICELAKTIPSYILHMSPDGAFWEEIESVLNG